MSAAGQQRVGEREKRTTLVVSRQGIKIEEGNRLRSDGRTVVRMGKRGASIGSTASDRLLDKTWCRRNIQYDDNGIFFFTSILHLLYVRLLFFSSFSYYYSYFFSSSFVRFWGLSSVQRVKGVSRVRTVDDNMLLFMYSISSAAVVVVIIYSYSSSSSSRCCVGNKIPSGRGRQSNVFSSNHGRKMGRVDG